MYYHIFQDGLVSEKSGLTLREWEGKRAHSRRLYLF